MPDNDKHISLFIRSCLAENDAKIALKDSSGRIVTYHELESSCVQNNPFIKLLDSSETVLIAVLGNKSAALVEILFSVLVSGNAYLPLDYYSPPERLAYMIRNAGCKALVVERDLWPGLEDQFAKENRYKLSELNEKYFLVSFGSCKAYESDIAYVLYTSGSTGLPKGVVHTHKSAMAFINWLKNLDFSSKSKFISIAPFSFDISVLDLFAPLSCNGSLFIPQYQEISNSRLVKEFLLSEKINVVYSTPGFFKSLLLYGKTEDTTFGLVTHVIFAGEQLYYQLVSDSRKRFVNAVFFNLYGPTETNVCCYYRLKLEDLQKEQAVPIGKMCDYAKSVLKENSNGTELLVASESLMKGYVDTEVSFETIEGSKYYRTGDLVMKNEDGDLVFKGRTDNMIKRNGYRIELMEIESCLGSCHEIDEFAVKTSEENGNLKIFVYFSSRNTVSELWLKNYVLSKLPAYMLPDHFIQLESISKNSNLKTDLSKL